MKIRVAKTAGFCFGVRNALEITERELTEASWRTIVYLWPSNS